MPDESKTSPPRSVHANEPCAAGLESLAAGLFGPEVAVCTSPLVGCLSDLFPEERLRVAAAVESRVRAFATGRSCARRLLERFGRRDVVLPTAVDGSPIWPDGFVGSISHTSDLCLVAVARAAEVASVGVDVETYAELEEAVWELVCTPAELERVCSQTARRRGFAVAALFSAKEAIHKCVAPWSPHPFEPRSIAIEWDGSSPTFRAAVGDVRLLPPLVGRIAIRREWILSAVQIPRSLAAAFPIPPRRPARE